MQELQAKDTHDLLVIFLNWVARLIQPNPRRIERSKAYTASPYHEEFSNALNQIEKDIREGSILTKYLSKGVLTAYKPKDSRRGASDLDMLLNDWGIHHLHLSTELQSDGFVNRTGPLLFARFVHDTAYLLDIIRHGEWANSNVLETLVEEFPSAGGAYVLKGVLGVSHEHTDDVHMRLRAAGVNTVRMVGDKAVIGGGYNLQGRTVRAVREASRILLEIQEFENNWREDDDRFRKLVKAKGGELPSQPNFEFSIDDRGPLLVETMTRTALRIFS